MTGGRSLFSRTILYEYKGRKERRVHMSSRSALVAVVIELDSAKAMAVRPVGHSRQTGGSNAAQCLCDESHWDLVAATTGAALVEAWPC